MEHPVGPAWIMRATRGQALQKGPENEPLGASTSGTTRNSPMPSFTLLLARIGPERDTRVELDSVDEELSLIESQNARKPEEVGVEEEPEVSECSLGISQSLTLKLVDHHLGPSNEVKDARRASHTFGGSVFHLT